MSNALATPEPPPTKWSKWFWFRVSTSTIFALLTVALCVVWMRSYFVQDCASGWISPTHSFFFLSGRGWLFISVETLIVPYPDTREWELSAAQITPHSGPKAIWHWGKGFNGFEFHRQIQCPHWFLLVVGLTGKASTLLPYSTRFSLRTLLIATTLVAVVLGLMIWAVK